MAPAASSSALAASVSSPVAPLALAREKLPARTVPLLMVSLPVPELARVKAALRSIRAPLSRVTSPNALGPPLMVKLPARTVLLLMASLPVIKPVKPELATVMELSTLIKAPASSTARPASRRWRDQWRTLSRR